MREFVRCIPALNVTEQSWTQHNPASSASEGQPVSLVLCDSIDDLTLTLIYSVDVTTELQLYLDRMSDSNFHPSGVSETISNLDSQPTNTNTGRL